MVYGSELGDPKSPCLCYVCVCVFACIVLVWIRCFRRERGVLLFVPWIDDAMMLSSPELDLVYDEVPRPRDMSSINIIYRAACTLH